MKMQKGDQDIYTNDYVPIEMGMGMTFKSAGVEHIAGESHTVTSGHFLKKLIPK